MYRIIHIPVLSLYLIIIIIISNIVDLQLCQATRAIWPTGLADKRR